MDTSTAIDTISSTTATAASSSKSSSIAGMGDCKTSMLWNWYTIDACFISSTWHITSAGMFAGSCIGVICLVILLPTLRRFHSAYDRSILRSFELKYQAIAAAQKDSVDESSASFQNGLDKSNVAPDYVSSVLKARSAFRPGLLQQLIRAALFTAQFGVAYFIMLLAMFFNGYIIISILIGAFIGSFGFDWEIASSQASGAIEVTGCHG